MWKSSRFLFCVRNETLWDIEFKTVFIWKTCSLWNIIGLNSYIVKKNHLKKKHYHDEYERIALSILKWKIDDFNVSYPFHFCLRRSSKKSLTDLKVVVQHFHQKMLNLQHYNNQKNLLMCKSVYLRDGSWPARTYFWPAGSTLVFFDPTWGYFFNPTG